MASLPVVPAGRSIASPVPTQSAGGVMGSVGGGISGGGADADRWWGLGHRRLAGAQGAPALAAGVGFEGLGRGDLAGAKAGQQLAAEGPTVVAAGAAARFGRRLAADEQVPAVVAATANYAAQGQAETGPDPLDRPIAVDRADHAATLVV